jgi:predicted RNA-binding Zn ribbon-like protein
MYHENMAQESTATRLQSRSWVLPEEPAAVRLMNTIWADRAGVHDDLRTTRDLADWLVAISATDGPVRVTKDDVARARRLRDALRRLAALCTDDTRVAAASEVEDIDVAIGEINSLVAVCPPTPRLALLDGRLIGDTATIGPPVTRALTAVASEAVELFTGADSPQLRACQAPGCVLYFLREHPRREWCSTACGNRARAARHYRRHRRGARADST